MIKMRVEALPEDIDAVVENLKSFYNVIEVSKHYPNRGESKLVRVYITIVKS